MKIGILGCGAIASTLVDLKLKNKLNVKLSCFYDIHFENSKKMAAQIDAKAVETLDELIENSDIILECASQQAVIQSVPEILKKGKDVIIMSIGALMDNELYSTLESLANENNSKIYLPSGAITGIDTINAANIGEIESVSLTTRKPPVSLDVTIEEGTEKVLFEGKASEAVKHFPKNINVSSTLSLASGMDVDVTIIADSKVKNNTHEVHVKGEFGELTTITSNVSLPNNPKTSMLAALSVASLLNKLNQTIKIGA